MHSLLEKAGYLLSFYIINVLYIYYCKLYKCIILYKIYITVYIYTAHSPGIRPDVLFLDALHSFKATV